MIIVVSSLLKWQPWKYIQDNVGSNSLLTLQCYVFIPLEQFPLNNFLKLLPVPNSYPDFFSPCEYQRWPPARYCHCMSYCNLATGILRLLRRYMAKISDSIARNWNFYPCYGLKSTAIAWGHPNQATSVTMRSIIQIALADWQTAREVILSYRARTITSHVIDVNVMWPILCTNLETFWLLLW